MKTYFYLQFKRVLKGLPMVLCVLLLLFGALMGAYQGVTQLLGREDSTAKFKVALAGYTEDPFLEMGMAALEAFDSTRFAVEIQMMEESEAAEALARGDIAAYVVVPEGFMDAALHGDVMPLKYVSTNGAVGLVSMFKDEITRLISDILVACQKGAYGIGDTLKAQDQRELAYEMMDRISIQYVEFVFARSNTYSVRELGLSDGLGLEEYLLCGLSVLFLCLACLPFAPLRIRQDLALDRMLSAKGRSVAAQTACDFGAYLAGMLLILAVVLLALAGIGGALGMLPGGGNSISLVLSAALAVLTVTALSFFLYELSGNLISGVLLQFFTILALGFLSGCMYPVFFFPETVQRIAAWLPTGLARIQLANCVTGAASPWTLVGLLGYSGVFFCGAVLVRRHRVTKVRG